VEREVSIPCGENMPYKISHHISTSIPPFHVRHQQLETLKMRGFRGTFYVVGVMRVGK